MKPDYRNTRRKLPVIQQQVRMYFCLFISNRFRKFWSKRAVGGTIFRNIYCAYTDVLSLKIQKCVRKYGYFFTILKKQCNNDELSFTLKKTVDNIEKAIHIYTYFGSTTHKIHEFVVFMLVKHGEGKLNRLA